jgi:hypothetical protein
MIIAMQKITNRELVKAKLVYRAICLKKNIYKSNQPELQQIDPFVILFSAFFGKNK